jgi:hypothetical protein
MKDGTSLQIFAQALINVCHRLHAEADWNHGPNGAGLNCRSGSISASSWVL